MGKPFNKVWLVAASASLTLACMILPATAQTIRADAGQPFLQPPVATVHEPGAETITKVVQPSAGQSSTVIRQTISNPSSVTSTTTTVTQTESTPMLKPAVPVQGDQPMNNVIVQYHAKRLRSDRQSARRMAKDHWLDKAVEADPSLVEAICTHYTAALILAKHPKLGAIAQQDHYTCRRLTKWKSVARVLAKNGECYKVVTLDPQGIYLAIKRDPSLVKLLSTNPMFDQMVSENPDLGRLISLYM